MSNNPFDYAVGAISVTITSLNNSLRLLTAALSQLEKAKSELARLRSGLIEILEKNHQLIDPYCPWCGGTDYPVNQAGEKIDSYMDAAEYRCNHMDSCPVTLIEALLAGR